MPNHNSTLLGFDFGLKRIGVAIGQTLTKTANPLAVIPARNGVPDWHEVERIITTWQPDGLVVGIPYNTDGSMQDISERAHSFAEALKKFKLPVYEMDERLTTKEARQRLFDSGGFRKLEKAQVDSYAAKLILEDWLHTNKEL